MANLLSAHRDLANPQHRAEVARAVGRRRRAGEAGQDRGRDVRGRRRRRDQGALDRLHESGAVDARPGDRARARSQRCEFVVVQEAFADHRDLRLRRPAAAGDDLGREGRHRHQQRAPHQPRAAGGAGARRGARRLGDRRRLRAAAGGAAAARAPGDADAVPLRRRPKRSGTSIARSTARPRPRHHRPELRAARARGPQQWPLPDGAAAGRRASTTTACSPTADGRARFVDAPYAPVGRSRATRAIPFSLNTGRLRDQWHGMSRTGTLGPAVRPRRRAGGRDAPAGHGAPRLVDGDLVHVTSRRGSIVLPVQAQRRSGAGQAFIAMHWGEEFARPAAARSDGDAAGRRQRADAAGVLPGVEAARAQARGREGR